MFHHVYANDRSIACKAGDGASRAAFPDTCWTPPQPSPVPIPYPNTAYAKDLTNGIRTVVIQGTEVAKRDVSYFETSTGDEPATSSCGQGLLTGVIRGKAYFFAWSMNVKAEGMNVGRHLDLMGHNHASLPSNTPLFPFVERPWFGSHPCAKEEERIERACAKEDDDEDKQKFRAPKKKRFNLRKTTPGGGSKGPWHWKQDHCDGLEFFPSKEGANEFLNELKSAYNDMLSQEALLNRAKAELTEYLQGAALKAGGKVLAKAGVKQLGGSALPLIGNIAMGLWTAYDVVSAVSSIGELHEMFDDLKEYLGVLKDKLGDFKGLLDRYNKEGGSEALMADVMDGLATINPCTRARKCNLVPYKNKGGAGGKAEPSTGGGCCGGQTGHHLLPGAMARGACPGYNHSDAPTVCVEGRSQNHGSHKRVHDAFDGIIRGLQKAGKVKNGKISVDDAINAAAASHMAAFPLSRCSIKCIKAQLKGYYEELCPNAQLNAVDKMGKVVSDDTGGADTSSE